MVSKVYQLAASEAVYVSVADGTNLMKNLVSAGSGRDYLPSLMTRYCKTACVHFYTGIVPASPSEEVY